MLNNFFKKLIDLPKSLKILLQAIFDITTVFCSLAFFTASQNFPFFANDLIILFLLSIAFSFFCFLFGLYKSFVRFFSTSSLMKILLIASGIYLIIFLIHGSSTLSLFNWISSLFFTFSIIALPKLLLGEFLRSVDTIIKSSAQRI